MKKLTVQLITPEATIFKGEADHVELHGTGGDLGVLPGHEPLLVQLKPGEIRITSDSAVKIVSVSGGFAEILAESVKVFSPTITLLPKA